MVEFVLQLFFFVLQLPLWDASSENMGFMYIWVLVSESCQWNFKCDTDLAPSDVVSRLNLGFLSSPINVNLKFQVPLLSNMKTWTYWLNLLKRFELEVRMLQTAPSKSLLYYFDLLYGTTAEMI